MSLNKHMSKQYSYRIERMNFDEVDNENVAENSDHDEILDAAIT